MQNGKQVLKYYGLCTSVKVCFLYFPIFIGVSFICISSGGSITKPESSTEGHNQGNDIGSGLITSGAGGGFRRLGRSSPFVAIDRRPAMGTPSPSLGLGFVTGGILISSTAASHRSSHVSPLADPASYSANKSSSRQAHSLHLHLHLHFLHPENTQNKGNRQLNASSTPSPPPVILPYSTEKWVLNNVRENQMDKNRFSCVIPIRGVFK